MIRSKVAMSVFVLVMIGLVGCGKSTSNQTAETEPVSDSAPPEADSIVEVEEAVEEAEEAAPMVEESAADIAESASTAEPGDTGTLKIHFEYAGGPVERTPLNITQDAAFCGTHDLRDESLIVNAANNGLKNVVVYVYTGRGGSTIDPVPPRNATVTFANQDCRFEPHIGLAQVGDTLLVTNPDPVGHNFNIGFFNNKQENFTIPAGQQAEVEVKLAEPAPIPIDCNIHAWMKGYVVVLDHPYVGLSDENGDLVIEGLPVGKTLVFRAFHEAGAIRQVSIAGEEVEWARSRFERTIEAGENDMGTVVIPVFQ